MATAAILGRPNVGKSTLFNRLVGRKIALVDDQPGVTRDRREGQAEIYDLRFKVFDTAGLDDAPKGSLESRMSKQSEAAIADADVCLFVIDARAGVTPIDREFAGRLRKHGKPVVLVANKCEGRDASAGINEGHTLGFGEPVAISAEHGEGIGDLRDALAPYLATEIDAPIPAEMPLRLAIIGQPNAGKSTLVNTMVGSDRMLTGPEAGITRDAISVDWAWKGKPIKLWDTAGIRRKAKVDGKIEKLAVADALRAIRFADAVIVLIDASMEIESQDLTLSSLVAGEGRAMILVLSKWDLVEDKNKKLKDVKDRLEDILPEIKGITMVTISAKQEKGIPRMMDAILKAVEIWDTRLSTSKFNRWLEKTLERNPPPAPQGRRIKIRYGTQVKARPPTFALFGNQLEHLPETYVRYLMNGLRKDFELWGTPIRFLKRGSKNPYEKD
jgi:GTPase